MAMHKKSFSVDVDDEVSEAFSTLCDERGYTKYRALEGALRAFMAIPPEAQVALMSNSDNPKDILTKSFADVGLEEAEFRRRVLEILQEAQAVGGQKKRARQAKTSKSLKSP